MLECIFIDKNSSIPQEELRTGGDTVFSFPFSTSLGLGMGNWGQNYPSLSLHIQILETGGENLTSAICSPSRVHQLQEASSHGMRAWNEVLEEPSEGVMVQELSGRNFLLLPTSHSSTQHL